jgi:hypothetical protein
MTKRGTTLYKKHKLRNLIIVVLAVSVILIGVGFRSIFAWPSSLSFAPNVLVYGRFNVNASPQLFPTSDLGGGPYLVECKNGSVVVIEFTKSPVLVNGTWAGKYVYAHNIVSNTTLANIIIIDEEVYWQMHFVCTN